MKIDQIFKQFKSRCAFINFTHELVKQDVGVLGGQPALFFLSKPFMFTTAHNLSSCSVSNLALSFIQDIKFFRIAICSRTTKRKANFAEIERKFMYKEARKCRLFFKEYDKTVKYYIYETHQFLKQEGIGEITTKDITIYVPLIPEVCV